MIVVLLRLILVWFIARGLMRLVRGIAEGLQAPAAPKPPAATALVRDPVCGTFVVPGSALSAGSGAQTKFFCSERCRRAYTGQGQAPRGGAGGTQRRALENAR